MPTGDANQQIQMEVMEKQNMILGELANEIMKKKNDKENSSSSNAKKQWFDHEYNDFGDESKTRISKIAGRLRMDGTAISENDWIEAVREIIATQTKLTNINLKTGQEFAIVGLLLWTRFEVASIADQGRQFYATLNRHKGLLIE